MVIDGAVVQLPARSEPQVIGPGRGSLRRARRGARGGVGAAGTEVQVDVVETPGGYVAVDGWEPTERMSSVIH